MASPMRLRGADFAEEAAHFGIELFGIPGERLGERLDVVRG